MARSRVYRFQDAVALYLGAETGETVYLTPQDARGVANALLVASGDVRRVEFTNSTLGTWEKDRQDGRNLEQKRTP